jgi:subtilase family serine protease
VSFSLRSRGVCATGVAMLAVGLVPSVAHADASSSVAIAGTQPSWATPATAITGAQVTAGAAPVDLQVYLASQNPSGLAAAAQAVSSPSSSQYGQYLSAAQVQSEYGPSASEASAVSSWLQSNGFTVTGQTTGIGAYVEVTGTLADASQAFGVTFGNYTDPEGVAARAPQQAASAPASIAADITAISGLDTANHDMRPDDTTGDPTAAPTSSAGGVASPASTTTLPPPGPNYWIAGPLSSFYGQNLATTVPGADGQSWPWNVSGYTPQQLRGAYGVTSSGETGAGQTVAIVDAYASPTMLADANEFSTTTGNAPFAAGQYQQILPNSYSYVGTGPDGCDAPGWYGEETLDVESVHATAPGANVVYVGARSCYDTDLLAADAKIVNEHLATIVSDSWGDTADGEEITNAYEQVYEAGTLEGIGFFFSSGDDGYEQPTIEDPGYSDKIQVDFPTSSPWVTSVGGTSLAVGARDQYEGETSWGTLLNPLAASGKKWSKPFPATYGTASSDWEYDGSSGGGVSTEFQQPWYQQGVVPGSLATAVPQGSTTTPMRVVPDVSALADPSTGILVGETQLQPDGSTQAFSLSRIGGTSVASPVFAGIEADAQQAYGKDIGFANPLIYDRAGTSAFHDVTDEPLGYPMFVVRRNYSNPYAKTGPLLTYLRTLGVDGQGKSALPATTGYDDSTGVGSPDQYIDSFK